MKTTLIISAIVSWAVMTLLWLRQRKTHNATSVDMVWAFGIGLETIALAVVMEGHPLRRAVIAGLVSLWSLRLGGHLFFDRVKSGVEDGRYTRFRREWNAVAFYGLFVAQAVLVFLLPLTFLGGFSSERPFPSSLDIIAFALWSASILGEGIADRQLARFRADPANKGRTCREGLWRFSRHPNYFFEWLIWCAYIPFAVGSAHFFTALLGPSLLLFFLLKVSGIPPTEAQALESRGDDYRRYQRTTSAFIPWFPKEERS